MRFAAEVRMEGDIEWLEEEWEIALQAAYAMSKRWKEDAAILYDFSVVKLSENEEPPLEVIRYINPLDRMTRVRR
tara:strand:+ start:1025 stop:1249 length:225 start_codon:yes stop_codon:yes gene_type:complete